MKVRDTVHELWNAVMDTVWFPAVFHQRRNLRPPKLVCARQLMMAFLSLGFAVLAHHVSGRELVSFTP